MFVVKHVATYSILSIYVPTYLTIYPDEFDLRGVSPLLRSVHLLSDLYLRFSASVSTVVVCRSSPA